MDEVNAKLPQFVGATKKIDKEREALLRTVKLSEEVGELSEAILAAHNRQRSVKLKKYTTNHLLEEFADVIISTLLLAETMGVKENLDKAITDKIKKINRRFAKD